MRRSAPACFLALAVCTCWTVGEDRSASLTPAQEALVRRAVWGEPAERPKAVAELIKLPATPERVKKVEALIRAGRAYDPVAEDRQTLAVASGDRQLALHVLLPTGYDSTRRYPLMLAMGGGPMATEQFAKSQANMMTTVWLKPAAAAGWLVAVVEDTVSLRKPGKALRYNVLTAGHARALLDAVTARFAVDPNRIHSTGISLGSNYSQAYAAAHPDWLAGILPVSTEGDSREHVLRNLQHVSCFVLEGAKDKNIKSIDGPRRQAKILDSFGYRHKYEEDPKRGHEGFSNRYPDALAWLAERPRPPFPPEVIRLPHAGILMPGKRFYWLEADTHQAAVHASVKGNVITVQAARARKLTFHLSDRLLNLDEPISVRINGQEVHKSKVERSLRTILEDAALLNDTERFASVRLSVTVPDLSVGEEWLASLAPKIEAGPLAFWEDFAVTTLKEDRPRLPAELELVTPAQLPAGLAAARVKAVSEGSPLRPDDLVLSYDDEPFFAVTDGVGFLRDYLWRTTGRTLLLKVLRQGKEIEISLPLK